MNIKTKYLAYLILIISTIIGFKLIWPLFQSGAPINIDLPLHYARLQCWESLGSWSLVSSWCPWFQAGFPPFHSYTVFPFQIAALLSSIISLELAFKLVLVLIYFTLPAAAFLLLNRLNHPLAGSFAYAFLLFDVGGWQMGGFEQIFMVGMFAQAFGTALLFLSMYFGFRFFEEMNNKNLVLLSISSAALLLTHPVSFTLFTAYLVIFAIMYRKKLLINYKKLLLYPTNVFFLSGFWFIPMMTRRMQGYYQNILSGIQINPNDIIGYFYGPINKYLLLLGVIGLIIAFFAKKKSMKRLGIMSLVVPAIFLLAMYLPFIYELIPISQTISEIRLLADLRAFVFIFAGLTLGSLAKLKFNLNKRKIPIGIIISLIVFLLLASAVYPATKQKSQSIMTTSIQDVQYLKSMYEAIPPGGRILQEQLLYRLGSTPLSFTHAESLGPSFIDREFIVYNPAYFKEAYVPDYFLSFLKKYANNTEELNEFFKRTNIKYVVFSQGSQDVNGLKELLKDFNATTFGPFIIYDTRIIPSNFEIDDGEVKELFYDGLSAKAEVSAPKETKLLFKVHDYPNWKITIDGKDAERLNKPGYLMEIKIPKGKHTIEFEHKLLPLDYVVYILTLIGIIGSVYLWRKKSH